MSCSYRFNLVQGMNTMESETWPTLLTIRTQVGGKASLRSHTKSRSQEYFPHTTLETGLILANVTTNIKIALVSKAEVDLLKSKLFSLPASSFVPVGGEKGMFDRWVVLLAQRGD